MKFSLVRRLLAAVCLLCAGLPLLATAGNLARADIERMVDYFYVVGEIQPDLPVYPLFVKDPANPEAKPELKAYVFETLDFAPVRGYSGKPINLLIIMDLSGNFLKVRLLDHKEPLFLDTAGVLKLERFAAQYKGLSTRHSVEIGPYNDPGLRDETLAHVKGVQQGTISVKAINRAILTAAAAVATGKLRAGTAEITASTLPVPPSEKPGPVSRDTKDAAETKPSIALDSPTSDTPGTRTAPGAAEALSAADKAPRPTTGANNHPPPVDAGLLAGQGRDEPLDTRDTPSPAATISAPAALSTVESVPGTRVGSADLPDWLDSWQSRSAHIAILLAGLVVLSLALFAQRRFSADRDRMRRLRTLYLLFTVGFIGWTAQGQLTIVNITAAIESLASGGDLSFLMHDPITVVLWVFVGVTLLVWGRGTFCGWLCPFGALQELISLLANVVGVRQRRLRAALDARLKWLKYLVLAVILISLYAAPPVAELATEIEPFKTAISLYFVRDWPYVLWAAACLAAGVVVYRGYCRFLCPLGAALASADVLRRWSWIPRREACGTPCQTCRHRCEYQAISSEGAITYRECFQCLDCVSIYQDPQRCLPLIREHKRSKVVQIVQA